VPIFSHWLRSAKLAGGSGVPVLASFGQPGERSSVPALASFGQTDERFQRSCVVSFGQIIGQFWRGVDPALGSFGQNAPERGTDPLRA
jgi:hypothetical protein